jgi:hypothetical protein
MLFFSLLLFFSEFTSNIYLALSSSSMILLLFLFFPSFETRCISFLLTAFNFCLLLRFSQSNKSGDNSAVDRKEKYYHFVLFSTGILSSILHSSNSSISTLLLLALSSLSLFFSIYTYVSQVYLFISSFI